MQNEAKAKGHPWTMAKMFDTSLPVSGFIPASSIPDPHNVQLWCKVNEEMRQDGNTKDWGQYNLIYLVKPTLSIRIITLLIKLFIAQQGSRGRGFM